VFAYTSSSQVRQLHMLHECKLHRGGVQHTSCCCWSAVTAAATMDAAAAPIAARATTATAPLLPSQLLLLLLRPTWNTRKLRIFTRMPKLPSRLV
jgi:hypothetical protein